MEELLKQILTELQDVKTSVNRLESKVDRIEVSLSEQHIENIEADNRLLEAIRTTNDRLDFQRDKLSRTEEDIYLLKQK